MNKKFIEIIDEYIAKSIPSSVKINETIYDYQRITDEFINGNIIMRTQICKTAQTDNFFFQFIKFSALDLNLISIWGLNIIQYMIWSVQKTENAEYILFIKDIFIKFMQAVQSESNLLEQTIDAVFPRTIILINLYYFLLQKNDTFAEDIYEFLTKDQADVLESIQKTNAPIYCSKLLIYKMANDQEHMKETIIGMKIFIDGYINEDGSSKDFRLLSNSYFNRFFSLFMDLLEDCQVKDDELPETYNNNVTYLRTMTNHEGFFPSLNGLKSGKSAFESLNETRYFKDSGYFVSKDEDVFFLQNVCNQKEISQNLCSVALTYGKNNIFLENAIVEDHIVYTKPYFVERGWNGASNRCIDFAPNSKVNVKIDNATTIIDVTSDAGDMHTSYKWGDLDNSIAVHCNSTSKYEGLKYVLILSSRCREVKLYKDSVSFLAGGFLPVSIHVQSDFTYQINLSHGRGDEEGSQNEVLIIEILCVGENAEFNIEIIFDRAKYCEYKRNICTFLPEKAKRQIESVINSDVFSKLMQYGNIGATEIYRMGRQAYLENNLDLAKKCEILNNILHSCIIKSTCEIGEGSRFAYGGGGSLVHANTVVGKYCMIGFGATLANAPQIGDYVYIAPGVRFAKTVHVGNFCVIGANAVVNRDIEPFTISAGVPARNIGKITPSNLDKYLISYFAVTDKTNDTFVEMIRAEFLRQYEEYGRGGGKT